MQIIYTDRCLNYYSSGHPESPHRVSQSIKYLKARGYECIEPVPCSENDILRVHTYQMVEQVKTEMLLDPDTPALPGIYDFARLSAGAAIMACNKACAGETAFSMMRPPGHHATRTRSMGFCYFNNMAIAAARHLLDYPENKIAILDIDVHHGNGTEEIFKGNKNVIIASIHQLPLFPGTGWESTSNSRNIPLPPGTGEDAYLKALDLALAEIQDFRPDMLGISIGFDTYKDDYLAQFNLEIESFGKISTKINELNKPMFFLLEGGYSPDMPECVNTFLENIHLKT